jgi:hypothetical protein
MYLPRIGLALGVLLAGCRDDGPTPPGDDPVASVRFAAEQDTALVGTSLLLSVEIRDASENLITDRTVSFRSLDLSVFTVTGNRARAIAIGTTGIVASVGEISDTLRVLAAPVVTVGRNLPVVLAGDTTALFVTLSDAAGAPLTAPVPSGAPATRRSQRFRQPA